MEDTHIVIDNVSEDLPNIIRAMKKNQGEKKGKEKEEKQDDLEGVIRENVSKYKRVAIYCVFDGHGGFASGTVLAHKFCFVLFTSSHLSF